MRVNPAEWDTQYRPLFYGTLAKLRAGNVLHSILGDPAVFPTAAKLWERVQKDLKIATVRFHWSPYEQLVAQWLLSGLVFVRTNWNVIDFPAAADFNDQLLGADPANQARIFERYVAQIHALRGLIKAHDRPILGVALQTAAPKDEFLLLPRHMGPM